MSIHGLNSIANLAIQVGPADPAGSRVGLEAKVAPSTTATSAPGPAAIYHPSKNESSSELGGLGDVKVYSWDSKVEENRRMTIEMMNIWIEELPAASAGLRSAYDTATADLSPELLQKDWGFSVSNGELVILEGSDALSDGELATLKHALAELTPAANTVAETVTRMIVLDRGTYGFSNGIGRFDVSTENFADVVDLRNYLLDQGANGKYNQARNPSDLESVHGWGGWAMMDQIEANAAVRFSVPEFPF